jgi:hypothetical protein
MSGTNAASVLARLLNLAKQSGEDYNLLLNRFALERLLCRISASEHADRFLLKGALLFTLWYDTPHRPTRDADFLGFGPDGPEHLTDTFRSIAGIDLGDGITFAPDSVRVESIREDTTYGGWRVRLEARIGNARCALHVDVGFGDAVTPAAESVTFPVLLADLAAPRLQAYPVYTVIAEKYHAMVSLGIANSRMKDFFDLSVIAHRSALDGATLARAIGATFARRQTPLPVEAPLALTAFFADDEAKRRQWAAFLGKARLSARPLPQVIALLHDLLWPPTQVAASGSRANAAWRPELTRWS